MTDFQIPTAQAFLAESEDFLRLCELHCRCDNAWHFAWSAYKASGRRRSVYYQQPQLRQLLGPWLDRIDSVLIAGAADTGILEVLSSLLSAKTRYHVFDVCAAPLRAIETWADQQGLSLTCEQVALQDFRPRQRHGLVFLHNTFGFLWPNETIKVLSTMKQALEPEGLMACGMRYSVDETIWGPEAEALLTAEIQAMVEQTYGADSASARRVLPHLGAYARSRSPERRPSYTPESFAALLHEAGYRCLDSYTDRLTPSAVLNATPRHHQTRSDVHLLVPA